MSRHGRLPRIDCVQPVAVCLLRTTDWYLHHSSRAEAVVEYIVQSIGTRGVGRCPAILIAVCDIAVDGPGIAIRNLEIEIAPWEECQPTR